jgi:hypothetical protein
MQILHSHFIDKLATALAASKAHLDDIDYADKEDDAFLLACPRESAEGIKQMFDKIKEAADNLEPFDRITVNLMGSEPSTWISDSVTSQLFYRVLIVKWGAYTLLKRPGGMDGLKSLYENHVKDAGVLKLLPLALVAAIEQTIGKGPRQRLLGVQTDAPRAPRQGDEAMGSGDIVEGNAEANARKNIRIRVKRNESPSDAPAKIPNKRRKH